MERAFDLNAFEMRKVHLKITCDNIHSLSTAVNSFTVYFITPLFALICPSKYDFFIFSICVLSELLFSSVNKRAS